MRLGSFVDSSEELEVELGVLSMVGFLTFFEGYFLIFVF